MNPRLKRITMSKVDGIKSLFGIIMADKRNIIISLLIVVVIILLAFLAFRPMMYSSIYGPSGYQPGQMGPGMMNNPGYNYSSGSGMMHNQGYNYSYGSGMMGNMMTGNMMMDNMMALYYPGARPITQDEALSTRCEIT